ncbi:S8 family serine peptidase [Streptomyces sp.]|uniref:S8 family serine peptidase n=1 Tax=Streptomyces sp. TaxID=1931 RepID=UPI0039C95099
MAARPRGGQLEGPWRPSRRCVTSAPPGPIWPIPPPWATLWGSTPHERLPRGGPGDTPTRQGCPGGPGRLRQRRLPGDAEGGTGAASAAGADVAEKYGARIGHPYGTVLDGYAERANEEQARRLTAGNRALPASLHSPADVRQARTAGATGPRDARAPLSRHGPVLDLFAPGVAPHRGGAHRRHRRAVHSGTPTASPHVTGAAPAPSGRSAEGRSARTSRAPTAGTATGGMSGRGLGAPDGLLQVPRS